MGDQHDKKHLRGKTEDKTVLFSQFMLYIRTTQYFIADSHWITQSCHWAQRSHFACNTAK